MTGGRTFAANRDEVVISHKNKANDGKFSCSQALKNFGEGLASPITELFSSPKNFVIGAGMIAGSMALVAATGGAAAPLLVAAGVGMGAIQATKATYKLISAKNGDDMEKAFYDVGGATSTVGLSALGAKGSLRQANIDTKGLDVLAATKKCFTSVDNLVNEGIGVFKSGYFKSNLVNMYRALKQPLNLKKYSKNMDKEGKRDFKFSYQALKNLLPEELRPFLKGRSKSQLSIYEKLVKESNISGKVEKIKNDPSLSAEAKQKKINAQIEKRNKIRTDETYAKGMVEDLLGARLILEDTSSKNIEKLVSSLINAVEKGDIEISEIENYSGKKTKFYFTEDQVDRIRVASQNKVNEVRVQNANKKASGYCAVQLKVRPKGGEIMELQIRGKQVDKVGDWEHIPYDLRHGKDISKGNNRAGILLAKVQKAIKSLNEAQFKQYIEGYIQDNYVYAQKIESGLHVKKPVLPADLDSILNAENLEILFNQTKGLPSKAPINPFDIMPTLPLVASVNQLKSDN